MAQTYVADVPDGTTNILQDNINGRNNENTLRSSFSGTVFPDTPVAGQHCYRTDVEIEYIYDGATWVEVAATNTLGLDVAAARGVLNNLSSRLNVSINPDGTLKDPTTANVDEFKMSNVTPTYVDATTFSVPDDLTGIFTAGRIVKITDGAEVKYLSVVSSVFNTVTNVVIDGTITASIAAVDYSLAQYGLPLASETVKGIIELATSAEVLAGTDTERAVTPAGFKAALASTPCYYSRSTPFASAKTTIATPVRLWVNIALDGYIKEASETLNLNDEASWDSISPDYRVAATRAGKDFYVYACVQLDGTFKYLLSANSTVPTGYTADNSRKVGGFHCLCVAVGTISGHTLTGYVAGDIIPNSMWDIQHRPASEPEGMVYVSGLNLWVDIYLSSLSDGKLKSVYGGVIADGASATKFHGYHFDEYFGLIKKKSLWQSEFEVASQGSNQLTNIAGSADPNTTGGHVDTASRRMVSNYGLEDCCGVLYQWCRDSAEFTPGATWTSPNPYLSVYGYKDIVYDSTIETSQGQTFGIPRRVVVGGRWTDSVYCGSRYSRWDHVPSYLYSGLSCRGASEPSHS